MQYVRHLHLSIVNIIFLRQERSQIAKIEKIVEESLKSEVNWEFNKKDTSLFDGLQEFMKKIPEFSGFKNYSENTEFEEQGTSSNSPFSQGQKVIEGGN